MSISGAQCKDWSGTRYPSEEANYCRNPDLRESGPFCVIQGDHGDLEETCGIEFCKRKYMTHPLTHSPTHAPTHNTLLFRMDVSSVEICGGHMRLVHLKMSY